MTRAVTFSSACVLVCGLSLASSLSACGSDAAEVTDAGGDAGGDDVSVPQMPSAKFLPEVTGTCPGFSEGEGCERDDDSLICTFQPADVDKPRKVRVWFDENATASERPLLVFWHGLGGQASNAEPTLAGMGDDSFESWLADGAIIVAPEKEEGRNVGIGSLPWLAALGLGRPDDFLVMDEVVACAADKIGVDFRRVHSIGMSAGGLQSGQVSVKRSGYVASAVLFSGGIAGKPEAQNPDNKLPVAVFYGGPQDIVEPAMFEHEAEIAREWLKDHDQFSILCNHNMMHTVPTTASAAGLRFLKAHPFGTIPSPYADELPSDFPADYCEL